MIVNEYLKLYAIIDSGTKYLQTQFCKWNCFMPMKSEETEPFGLFDSSQFVYINTTYFKKLEMLTSLIISCLNITAWIMLTF